MLLVGLAIAIGSAATALAAQRYAAGVAARLPDEAAIRTGVGRADTKTIYEVWRMMRQAGVDRGPLPDEINAQRTAASTERIAWLLWAMAAAGGGLAVAGLAIGLLARDTQASRRMADGGGGDQAPGRPTRGRA